MPFKIVHNSVITANIFKINFYNSREILCKKITEIQRSLKNSNMENKQQQKTVCLKLTIHEKLWVTRFLIKWTFLLHFRMT